ALADAVASPHSHVHPDLLDQVDALLDRLATYERAPAADPVVADLRRRVEQLERSARRAVFHPFFSPARLVEELGARPAVDTSKRLSDHQPVFRLEGEDESSTVDALAAVADDSLGAIFLDLPTAMLRADELVEVAALGRDKVRPN